ncbi:MAG: hypothetical protein OEU49_04175 [Chromatiales bacterium]|nr:hypothetical protein [Chromatiales bacterium]
MKKLIAGSLLAAVAMFIFGAVYWSSPVLQAGARDIGDDAAVQAVLRQTFPETGLYWVPGNDLYAEDAELYTRLHEAGPVAMINITQSPGAPMGAKTFIFGFLHEWVVCFLIGLLLVMVSPALDGYGARVGLVTFTGLTMAVFVDLGAVIWWRMPLAFQLVDGLYNVVAWMLAGLVLARFVPGKDATAVT